MTESEFLIQRALFVFNLTYGTDINVDACDIYSIKNDPHSDRAYEIITPRYSEFFRIRYYFTWGEYDTSTKPILEVTMPYINGRLGDEVYVIHSVMAYSWGEADGYKFDPIEPGETIDGSIITEDGLQITTETGVYIVLEDHAPIRN